MATQDKLQKSLEILKNLINPTQSYDVSKKKEKVLHCNIITDAISNPTIKVSANFPLLLSNAIEVLLKLCDDQESDIRMTSEECLNRIIRSVNDENIGKIQIELHKEIKRNGPARSLRAALIRFGQLAHLIRPHKCKAYVSNLFPSIHTIITQRNEEQVHETLALSLPKFMKVLGCFCSDNEIKMLLKAFLGNVSNQSAVIRRTTANCILTICIHCRKPYMSLSYCLNNLLDLLVPINDNQNTCTILGVMNALKTLLPNIKDATNEDDVQNIAVDKLLQIYELCMYYLNNQDHNITNSCLETLNVLLLNGTDELKKALINPAGILKNRISYTKSISSLKLRSPSQLSVATNTTLGDDTLFQENELTDSIQVDIEKWIDNSQLSVMNLNSIRNKEEIEKSQSFDNTLLNVPITDYDNSNNSTNINFYDENYDVARKNRSTDTLDRLTLSENSSEKSFSCATDDKNLPDEYQVDVEVGDILDKEIPLFYCSRLIIKSFLLTGNPNVCMPDKMVRVSVKSLALTCLSSICQLYPNILLHYLDRNYNKNCKNISDQQISDIFLYAEHSDPQLRGAIRILIGNFIKTILIEHEMNYKEFIDMNLCVKNGTVFNIDGLIDILIKGLEDESSNCTKQTLSSLKNVLNRLLESRDYLSSLNILNALPMVVKNPYWLIKVELCELVAKLSYVTIFHLTNNNDFQNKILFNVLFELLKDSDQRVRNAAANSIVEIIPNLYNEQYRTKESTITTKAIHYKNLYLNNLWSFTDSESNTNRKHFIENMPFPYCEILQQYDEKIDYSLSKIVKKLYTFILKSTSRHFIFGCLETLSLLSNCYPSTLYPNSWTNVLTTNDKTSDKIPDLLSLCINLLNSSTLTYDLTSQINILNLTSNLYAGQSLLLLRPIPDSTENSKTLWDMLCNKPFSDLSEQYLCHLLKLLNILHHVVNELTPMPIQSKPVLQNLPSASNLSPIKRRKSDLEKRIMSPGKLIDEKSEKKDIRQASLGTFVHCPHYMKLYEISRSSFTNYKISLESETSEKFIDFLRKILHSLSVIMEIATLTEFGRIAEDILSYLRSLFILDASTCVECVQQLLKCLFGTNITANIQEILYNNKKDDNDKNVEEFFGFYYNVLEKPYNDLSLCVNSLRNINKTDCDSDSTVMGYLHRKDVKQTLPKSCEKTLANYIRIFEPMVIKSLKQYTITSDINLQCKVLQLLSQLVQLRVNYCLLDSEQVFIGFVFKQIEFIEEGQIMHSYKLIPKIFQFLVQLSYSKQHSKSIISVPKIIQLCDGLMASGQSPLTHCIPSLESVVEDIFFTRNKSNTNDMKELETTREVVLSMLLRLCEYHQVIDFITIILEDSKYCSDNPDKWLRWSQQVVNVMFPLLRQNKIRLDDMESFISFRKFIYSLNPLVFKPIDSVVRMLFQEPPPDGDNLNIYNRWLAKILLLLLILMPIKEETILLKIEELKSDFSPKTVFENVNTTADPLNVINSADTFQGIEPETILIRFIFRVLTNTSQYCLYLVKTNENEYLVEQISTFLMYCLYIFQSGNHCKLTNSAILFIKEQHNFEKLELINKQFLSLAIYRPTLTFQWCYFLTLLNHNSSNFWSNLLQSKQQSDCINVEIIKAGASIIYCDFLCENSIKLNELSWLLENNIQLIINLCEEAPIFEFISWIHRSSDMSKLFLENISVKCLNIQNSIFKTKILKCIENAHQSQIGTVLNLLLPKMLNDRHVIISRLVANLASRKIELLLTMPMEEVSNQLPKENLIALKNVLVSTNLIKKYETLVGLLNKLSTQFYDLSPLECDQRRVVNPDYIKCLQINKSWYLTQIQNRSEETAMLLNKLEYDEIVNIISSNEFNKCYIEKCIELGVDNIKKLQLEEEPPIIKACIFSLLNNLAEIRSKLPKPHQVFMPHERNPTLSETKYTDQMTILFNNVDFYHLLHNLAPSVSCYIKSLPYFPIIKIPDNSFEDIVKFSIILLESLNFLLDCDRITLNINLIDVVINCTNFVLKEYHLCNILALDTHISWMSSAVNSLYKLINCLVKDEPLPTIPKYGLKATIENLETVAVGHACHQLYILVYWLYNCKNSINIPDFLLKPLKSIIISLSRLPLLNSYILVPYKVWKNDWLPTLSGPFNTQAPPLPIEYLQEDIEVLEEYIFRTTLLGWTSRQQFEETWMCLLSVLCAPNEDIDQAMMNEIVHASSLAIKAITSLLLQTLYFPVLGNCNVSELVHVGRDSPIDESKLSVKKLKKIQDNIQYKCEDLSHIYKNNDFVNVFARENFEKFSHKYSYGQLSVKYLLLATKIVEGIKDDKNHVLKIFRQRNVYLEESGLDINSCLQFLIDYYTQLLKPQSMIHLRMLYEAVRSTVMISDLFTDKAQFVWMLDIFLDLSKIHIDDELLLQYLIVGICKSAAVLTPDLETYEQIKKLLLLHLKSSFLPLRIACLHGLLYLLEGCKLTNITLSGISDEMQLILPCTIDYIQYHFNNSNNILQKSKEHTYLVWSLAFYIIENVEESHLGLNFVTNTLQVAFNLLQTKFFNSFHKALIKGLERLLIVCKSVREKMAKRFLKLALETMKHDNPIISIRGIQLLLSYMYTDCSEHLENSNSTNTQTNPDHLVQTIEKISAIFERIKKGHVIEVEIISNVLPQILYDFFTPSDILTKVIGEFLSPQQPHPKFLSKIVFQLFEYAIEQKQLSLLQDWVVFSLSNFTQSFSVGMATWCLTCFFISASSNEWLRSLFPYVQTRVGRYEYEDRKMLCIAGTDFYKNLTNDKQKQTFIENFLKVKDSTDMPFNDLLASL